MLLISHEMQQVLHKQSCLGISAESLCQRCELFTNKADPIPGVTERHWGPGPAVKESHFGIPGSTAFVPVTFGLRH